MKKLHSLVFCALITPTLMVSSSAVLAQQSSGQNFEREPQSSRIDRGTTLTTGPDLENERTVGRRDISDDQYRNESNGFMDSAPINGMRASALIGAQISTTGDEDVGTVDDLIIGDDGQIVAIVVGVGGFLGMGEKAVAIGWGDVTRSEESD